MKKILFLILCLIPLAGFGQSVFKRGIMVGTTDSTAVVDSIVKYDSTMRTYSGLNRIYDTKLLEDAGLLNTYAPIWADTTGVIATKTDILNIEGGSGVSGKFYYLSGNVDGSGFPDAGDSLLTHTNFIGKHLTVIREGQIQQQHTLNTTQDGFKFDNATGTITFRPILNTGEQLEIWSTNTIQWENLVAEGGGGEAESVLLDSLIAYYSLDEISGTNANEQVGNFDGTIYSSTSGTAAKVGLGVTIGSTGAIVVPYAAGLASVSDKMSISLWVKTSTLPSVAGTPYRLFTLWDATTHIVHSVYIYTDNKIWASFMNTTADEYFVSSAGTVSNGTWYHIVAVCEGTGRTLKLYVNNVVSTGNAFSGTLHAFNHSAVIGNEQNGYGVWLRGIIDEVGYWYQRLVPTDVVLLYQSGSGRAYPFN